MRYWILGFLPLLAFADFFCPDRCGQWGSKSIQSLEWEFIQCLYDADAMTYYIDKNDSQRSHYNLTLSKDFIPQEVVFPEERPTNFDSKWYQKILDTDEFNGLSLSECIRERYGCENYTTAT